MDAKPIELDAAGRLLTHVTCVRCGYDLLGAEAEGRCPECGLAVGRSTRGSWLRYCDPDWLQTIWGGLNRLAVVIVCGLAVAWLVWSGWMTDFQHRIPEWLVLLVPLMFFCTAVVVGVRGIWVATKPEPDQLDGTRRWNAARLCRLLLVGSCVGWPFALTLTVAVYPTLDEGEAFLVPFLLFFMSFALLLYYASRLTKRVPHRKLTAVCMLTAATSMVTWTTTLWLIGDWFQWVERLDAWIYPAPAGTFQYRHWQVWRLRSQAFGLIKPATLLLIAFLPILFVWFYVVLWREARQARATWAAQPWSKSDAGSERGVPAVSPLNGDATSGTSAPRAGGS